MTKEYIKEKCSNLRLKMGLTANILIATISASILKITSFSFGQSYFDGIVITVAGILSLVLMKYFLDKNAELDKLTENLKENEPN
ncbi:MAG: hypothetical protein SFY32_04585 [Bacteroidota bacterium]|nr:hypothetical protein [Bacteroidota bacterium]